MRRISVASLVMVLVTACGGTERGADREAAPDASRLTAANQAAFDALVATGPASLDAEHLDHDVAGHDLWGPVPEAPPADPATAAVLEDQWAEATAAAANLATPEHAEAAGYQKAAADLPAVGAHYVNWTLVDAPFDPARPSMLLFDESDRRPTRLIGFSYWNRSVDDPSEGFAGGGDHWHMHHGYCFDDGFLVGEDRRDRAACRGDWLAGTDLWMAHAWVVEGAANPWGRFAPRNPLACPAPSEQVADWLRCPSPLPSPPGQLHDLLEANSLLCDLTPAGERHE